VLGEFTLTRPTVATVMKARIAVLFRTVTLDTGCLPTG